MLKKPLLLIGFFGVLLVIGGFIFNPSFVGHFTHDGSVNSSMALIGIFLIQFYMITIGGLIIVESIIFKFLPSEKRTVQYLFGICAIGLVIVITGVLLHPSFIEHHLNIFKVDEERFDKLCNIQLGIITLGFLIAFISVFLYRGKLAVKKLATISLVLVILIYLVVVDFSYVNAKYPRNIILKPGEYSKVLDLFLGRDILLSDFSPRSTLKVERRQILKAKYPVIDIHFHFHSPFMTAEDKRILKPANLIKVMDSLGVKTIVGFDAVETDLDSLLGLYQREYPDKFFVYSDMISGDQGRILTDEFMASLSSKLEKFHELGMQGIGEFPKDIGLKIKDTSGKIIPLDDKRLAPLFEKAGELGMPVIMHTADPTAFFDPINKYNERYIELSKYPAWSYFGPQFPSKEKLIKEREHIIKEHPKTIFIGCHMGMNPEDLSYVGYMLDTYPNYYVDISAVLSDLGRQPYTARKFFIKYQDRILFGTDGGVLFGQEGWTIERFYRSYFEFLETENEYIDYPEQQAHNQGNWYIYGINLPDDVLQKIYYKNAEKILFGNESN